MKERLSIRIFGFVQGVGFRFDSSHYASRLGLSGWVKNEPDGSVSIIAEGETASLQNFLNFCYNGVKYAKVVKIETHWLEAMGKFVDFSIRD